MTKDEIDKRLVELKAERQRLDLELETARNEAREALISGNKPTAIAAALAERISIVDDAIAELTNRLGTAAENAERTNRKRRVEAALDATRDRVKLAKTVDQALADLATNWTAYTEALRKDVGQVSGAGGDVTAVERALTNNRTAEPLVKALIQAGGIGFARSLGVDTPIRARHATTLADAEERVAKSLQAELLHIKASSPQPNVSREARAELDRMETNL